MYVYYGSYRHELTEANLRVTPRFEHSPIGQRTELILQFVIEGIKTADSQSELLSAINQMKAAYDQDGRDVKLVYPDGTVAEWYRSNQALGAGILVKQPPTSVEGGGAQWAAYWRYAIILEARFAPDNLAATFLTGYSAGIRRRGRGGALFDLVPASKGKYRKVYTTETSPVRLVQFGEVTGLRTYPRQAVPAPFYPNDLVQDADEYEEAQASSGQQTQFTIRYSYEFFRNGPFS